LLFLLDHWGCYPWLISASTFEQSGRGLPQSKTLARVIYPLNAHNAINAINAHNAFNANNAHNAHNSLPPFLWTLCT